MWGAPQPPPTGTSLQPPAGYLSRIKDTRPYSSSSALQGPGGNAPPDPRDESGNDSVSLLVPTRRKSNVLVPSPQGGGHNSSFFQPRSSGRFNDSFVSDGGNSSVLGGSSFGGTSLGPNSSVTRGRHSAFGPSGLRSRPGPQHGRGHSVDTRSPSVSFSAHRGGAVAASPGDDDDAPPPVQSLDDEDAMDTSGATAPAPARTTTTAGSASLQGSTPLLASKRSPLVSRGLGDAEESKLRTVCLYGFPRSLEGLVVDHFGLGLVSSEWIPFNQSEDGPGCVEAVYSDSHAALRALRRSGELVAGVALVGVRVKDDALQSALLLDGLSGFANEPHRPSASTPNPVASSSIAGTPQQRPAPRARASLGRPLSVIGTKDSALAPQADTSSSFLRMPGWSTPQAQTTELPDVSRSSSFLGRVGDAVFGW